MCVIKENRGIFYSCLAFHRIFSSLLNLIGCLDCLWYYCVELCLFQSMVHGVTNAGIATKTVDVWVSEQLQNAIYIDMFGKCNCTFYEFLKNWHAYWYHVSIRLCRSVKSQSCHSIIRSSTRKPWVKKKTQRFSTSDKHSRPWNTAPMRVPLRRPESSLKAPMIHLFAVGDIKRWWICLDQCPISWPVITQAPLRSVCFCVSRRLFADLVSCLILSCLTDACIMAPCWMEGKWRQLFLSHL